ncbi:MAG: hypothetical protein IT566_10655 [Rhodospirillaceae bacterium]|nr:hypothetical protein [Rhodospirillaceae bacterium]
MAKKKVNAGVAALRRKAPAALLIMHSDIMDELRRRGIVRSANNPTGDLAEYIFCKAYNWDREGNSKAGFDATCKRTKKKYQIKARRVTSRNKSRQLSAIRELDACHFDFLAGIIFNERYEVARAIIVPHSAIRGRCTYVEHTNSHKLLLHDDVWKLPGAKDVTRKLQAVTL